MTNEKLNELNLLQNKIKDKKNELDIIERNVSYKPQLYICGVVCELTPMELQMIKTRLQMELEQLEKEFEEL